MSDRNCPSIAKAVALENLAVVGHTTFFTAIESLAAEISGIEAAMVWGLFSRRKTEIRTDPRASVPDGEFVAVVGDLHGRIDLLERLWPMIEDESRRSACRNRTLIFVGDYVDRGSGSAEVVDRLLQGFEGFNSIFLKGNHDETLLRFLGDPSVGDVWRNFGGLDTLRSYGIVHPPGRDWAETRNAFAFAIPEPHVRFFKNLKTQLTIGDYLFVHAGIKPYVPMEEQAEQDLLWIRDEFLDSRANFGRIVVHGHTPTSEPVVRHNRIGIDTGAYMSGKLTALILEGRERKFLATS